MLLSTDAKGVLDAIPNISKVNIDLDMVKNIENDLPKEDKLSVLFLITEDYTTAFWKIFQLFVKTEEPYIISEFVTHSKNWKDKLLEAICICNNKKVIRKLGLSFKDLEERYMPKVPLYSENINVIAKSLYILCESLTESDISRLIKYVRKDMVYYDSCLDNVSYLELHMLYWITRGYISISKDTKPDLENLLKHLKTFDEIDLIYVDLQRCQNNLGNMNIHCLTNKTGLLDKAAYIKSDSANPELRDIKNGLCIILNQMFFSGGEYETRFGTNVDRDRLQETFKGFGFKVEVLESQTKVQILNKLKDLSSKDFTGYDCLFFCILSHGCKGSIISSDEKEISLEEIERGICTANLKNVIKAVIVQACQGKTTGQVNESNLTADGHSPSVSAADITAYKNFCMFVSTMQGFVSVRDKQQGSWFIQELCSVLQAGSNRTFQQMVNQVLKSVQNKRGSMNGQFDVAQLPELRVYRLEMDFRLPRYVSNVQLKRE